MKRMHWLIFIISALFFAGPSIYSSYTWPLTFIFAAPLLYVAIYTIVPWYYGFLWGFIALGTHLTGVLSGIDTLATGSIIERLVPVVLVISYTAVYALIWFALNQLLITHFSLNRVHERLILWTITYWLFILWMENYCLCIFGRTEGYFLFNPVFVLAEKPQLLTLLPYLGKTLLLLLVLCGSASLVYAYIRKTRISLCIVTLCTVPWLLSLLIPRPGPQTPHWLSYIAPMPIQIPRSVDLHDQALFMQKLFKHVIENNPNAQLLLMPESAVQSTQLSTTPSMGQLWSKEYVGKPVHIIAGSFRWEGTEHRNTLHWFYDGVLQDLFDKRHAMLLTEHIPPAVKLNILDDLFFSTFPQVAASNAPRPLFKLFRDVEFIPYICSELYFNEYPDDDYLPGSTILATTNDQWCRTTNIAYHMQLAARFKAIQWQRNILYISFLYVKYFDKYGNVVTLEPAITTKPH